MPSSSVFIAKQRAWQYWFVDGLTHLLLGVAILSISVCTLYPPRPHAFWQLTLCATLLALYVVVMVWQRQILEWLKTRITYPRTGYTESPFETADLAGSPDIVELGLGSTDERRVAAQRLVAAQRKRLSLAAALAIAASFAMLLIASRWVYTAIGVLFALALWVLGRNERTSWLTIIGLPILGLSMTIFVGPGSYPPHGVAWFMAGWGGLLMLDGAIALVRYLLRNPRPKVAQP